MSGAGEGSLSFFPGILDCDRDLHVGLEDSAAMGGHRSKPVRIQNECNPNLKNSTKGLFRLGRSSRLPCLQAGRSGGYDAAWYAKLDPSVQVREWPSLSYLYVLPACHPGAIAGAPASDKFGAHTNMQLQKIEGHSKSLMSCCLQQEGRAWRKVGHRRSSMHGHLANLLKLGAKA